MLVHKESRNLILNLKQPERVLDTIPTAKALQHQGVNLVVVPHREDEVRVLRNLGFDAPAPMDTHYDWPCAYPSGPYAHQRITAAFLSINPRAYCLNGLGSGKTLSALWAYDYLRSIKAARRMVVVGPLSTLQRTWADEVFTHFPHLTTAVLHGSVEKRLKLLANDFDIYIINHDGLKSKPVLEALAAREDIDVVNIDELATMRTASTDRFKAAQRLVANRKYVWGMTGTPIPNSPVDAWAQCRLITPHTVPKFFGQFRDAVMKQVTQYKWVARETALETVRQAMQPAVRFSREECIDLPPTTYQTREVELTKEQRKAFDDMMRQLKADYEGGQVVAVNEAVKLGKLIQIACLSEGTEVLTEAGWCKIEEVSSDVRVWDGCEWVAHDGVVFKGRRLTILAGGLCLTPDHLVMSTVGWLPAERMKSATSGGFDWAPVRLPDSHGEGWARPPRLRAVGVRLRVRHRGCAQEPIPARQGRPSLWVPARQQDARDGAVEAVQHMEPHAGSVLEHPLPGLRALRRAWDHGLRRVGEFVRGVLDGHASRLLGRPVAGPHRQRPWVRAEQLPVGYAHAASAEPSPPPQSRAASAGGGHWSPTFNAVRSAPEGAATTAVYDLVNCGPRSQFVVRGACGTPRIVHNCGVAYAGNGGEVVLPCQPRIEEVRQIIEEAEAKVIVFVPYTSALHHLANALREHFTVEVVEGATSKTERDRIFGDFQKRKDPRVLVANASAMSHGLTLTAANVIVWYGPTTSNEVWNQANARIVRPGQKLNTLIVHIESSPVERLIYDRLRKRTSVQGALLDMLKGGL